MKLAMFCDICEENGRTIRENNLDRPHNVSIGTLVEVKSDQWHGDGACEIVHARLWVAEHGRDCDGTPLYSLTPHPIEVVETIVRESCEEIYDIEPPVRDKDERRFWEIARMLGIGQRNGFPESSLTSVEVTEDLKRGIGALKWEDEE